MANLLIYETSFLVCVGELDIPPVFLTIAGSPGFFQPRIHLETWGVCSYIVLDCRRVAPSKTPHFVDEQNQVSDLPPLISRLLVIFRFQPIEHYQLSYSHHLL